MAAGRSERRRHLKAEIGLSEAAQKIIHAAFADRTPTYREIAEAVTSATGEKITISSLSRYWRFWKISQRAAEAHAGARQLLTELKEKPQAEVEQALEAIVASTIYEGLAEAEGTTIHPADLLRAKAAGDRVKLAKEKIAIEQQRKTLQEERLALDREKMELQREKKAAIDRPALFLEFFKMMVETMVQTDPQAAEVINRHFDRLMAHVKAAHA